MKTRAAVLALCLLFTALLAFGQVGNGTITGTVTDQAGAVVPGATVEAKNVDTGVVFSGASSNAGNYTITDLPVGNYTLTVGVKGFKTYTHTNLAVGGAATIREDVPLQVGTSSESVTVTAESTLLKTESGDLATNITITQIDELPLMGVGTSNSGTSGYRNWDNIFFTIPGVSSFSPGAGIGLTVNGLNTQSNIVEGQEATTRILGQGGTGQYYQSGPMGVVSSLDMAVQGSNYAPEFGTAGSVVINTTMRSGTNVYHGSGYDYFVNEDLNAGDPFSTTGCINPLVPKVAPACAPQGGSGGKFRPRNRRNDFGGTLGGPVVIPKIYNGHNKTFWFFSYEEYREATFYAFPVTAAVPAYTQGDFSAISPNGGPGGCSLCTTYGIQQTALGTPKVQKDALGNQMFANEIYDPATRGVVASSNLGFALPFPNNMIPSTRFSPLTVKLQNLISSLGVAPNYGNLTANYTGAITGERISLIPSIKIDHNLSARDKLSFFYSENNTDGAVSSPLGNADGLPLEIGAYRGTHIPTWTERLNYDRTLAPTLLLHLGMGYIRTKFGDAAPFTSFDPSQFGLVGFLIHRQFPSFTGMSGAYGGMQSIGTVGQIQSLDLEGKPTYSANLTWIKGKHTFKFGATLVEEAVTAGPFNGVTFATGTGPTSEPFTPTQNFNGFSSGFGYASWLLGDYSAVTQSVHDDPRSHDSDWAVFVQDSWKVTRKLTLDYGLRWDLFGVETEQYNRWAQFSETVPNALAGGHPGSTIFANTCNCSFYQPAYPFALAPRVGVAYQIDPKTVFRGGWGFTYSLTEAAAGGIVATNGSYPLTGINPFVNDQTPGWIQQPTWPVTQNIWPIAGSTPGTFGQVPTMPDANQNRPPRINQFSAGFQREITRSFILEAEYVGNRAAWLGGFLGGGTLTHVPAATYAQYGLYPYPGSGPAGYNYAPAGISCVAGNDCARAILSQNLNTTAVQQVLTAAGIPNGGVPYAGFPTNQPLSSVIGRPFPQYGAIGPSGSPTGDSKYDSLQIKATKRLSHNLQASGFFTWAQGFTRATRQDFFNPASTANTLMAIPPRTLNFSFVYTTPKAQYFVNHAKFVNTIIKDWQLSGFGNYQSAGFLAIPTTPNAEFLGTTNDIYNKGVPLYLNPKTGAPTNNSPLNGNFNPYTDLLLNPAAWTVCPVNTNCGNSGGNLFGAGINDFLKGFRGRRHPSENANIGRNFRIKERMNFQIRGEFIDIFNRDLELGSPSTGSPQLPVTKNSLGILTSGFGTAPAYLAPGSGGRTGPHRYDDCASFRSDLKQLRELVSKLGNKNQPRNLRVARLILFRIRTALCARGFHSDDAPAPTPSGVPKLRPNSQDIHKTRFLYYFAPTVFLECRLRESGSNFLIDSINSLLLGSH